jgi:hypothetical protein
MPCESEDIKKIKADFSMVLEVLRCALRKSRWIQTTEEESKRANQILSALLEEYGYRQSPGGVELPGR